jgi:hypothetical protein
MNVIFKNKMRGIEEAYKKLNKSGVHGVEEGYRRLGLAIVLQAAFDYAEASEKERKQMDEFFVSDYCKLLTGSDHSLDVNQLRKKLGLDERPKKKKKREADMFPADRNNRKEKGLSA